MEVTSNYLNTALAVSIIRFIHKECKSGDTINFEEVINKIKELEPNTAEKFIQSKSIPANNAMDVDVAARPNISAGYTGVTLSDKYMKMIEEHHEKAAESGHDREDSDIELSDKEHNEIMEHTDSISVNKKKKSDDEKVDDKID